jgi:flavin-dependent dehydrogenase
MDAGSYLAINPIRENLANVMLVVGKSEVGRWEHGDAFEDAIKLKAAALGREARNLDGVVRAGPRLAIGPLAHAVRARTARGALLVGDAAGFLDPFSGQGVHLALAGAERAAATVLALLAEPAREIALLRAYERETGDDMAQRARLARLLDVLIDVPFLAHRAMRRLRRAPARGRALLDALSGSTSPAAGLRPSVLAGLLL